MKKLTITLSMICLMLVISCEKDETTEDFQTANLETFDAETEYWSILNNLDFGMDQFDNLALIEKRAVWIFKYNRYKSDNLLTTAQEFAIDNAINFIETANFDENDLALDDAATPIENEFTADQSNFLINTLENNPWDINEDPSSSGNETDGCFWCNEVVGDITDYPCQMQFTNGEPTGFGRNNVQYTKRRMWIGSSRIHTISDTSVPCSYSEWQSEGAGSHYW